jgi:hypothetical protein
MAQLQKIGNNRDQFRLFFFVHHGVLGSLQVAAEAAIRAG